MSVAFEVLLLAPLLTMLVPVSVLLLQVACAMPRRRPVAPQPPGRRPRIAVLIPAHNESLGIVRTIGSILPQLAAGDRVVVVADNCTDDTARIASSAGAEVVERQDAARRGKGYALDRGVRHLERHAPEVVVVVDADCEVASGSIERIATLSAATGRPVQALYLMKPPRGAAGMAAVAEFAWVVKNLVRPLGFHRLGLPCQLMGTGMAFPWRTIRNSALASGHIVEDLKLGLDLSRAGFPPLFCPEALVVSYFPVNDKDTRAQRTRWEHGHLATIVGEGPRLLRDGLSRRSGGMLALALDLCVPPLALLTLSMVALVALCAVYTLLTSEAGPLALAGVVSLMFGTAVGLAWLRFGSGILPFGRLLLALAYAFRKIPLYLGFLTRRQVEWVRSGRDGVAQDRETWRHRWATIVDRIWVVRSPGEASRLLDWLVSGTNARILGFVNAHAMNGSAAGEPFFNALTCADVLLRDGAGMAILFRHLGRNPGLNMNGTDFIPRVLAAYQGKPVALWGTTEPWIGAAAAHCERRFGVRVVSREDGFKDHHSYVALARATRPALIVLGMGMPKQEQLASELRLEADPEHPPLIVCGGAILDFLGGRVTRAPGWMRRCGAEWLYRLLREPKRLCGRYLLGNPGFVFRLLAWRSDERFHRSWNPFQQ